jgi:glycosyltransferase involved in cell wall biosynthesis
MKVLVINTMAPFVWGGAEELADHLVRNLRLRNINAELLRLPFQWEPYDGIPAEIARFKAMRLPNVDRVISMKFPAYFIPAEHHTTWLVHQYRQAYDLWDSPYNNIPHDWSGEGVRDIIRAQDDTFFSRQRRLFTISTEVSRRLKQFNGVEAPALRAPINDPELFGGRESQGYILAPGRINDAKRQWLLVEAMQHMPTSARLIVAGPPETKADAARLHDLVEKLDLSDRVTLDLRFLDREDLANYVNHAAAVAYLPFQEDSYGYVTMEAFEAGKPVVTANDAGELLDIVIDQETGFVSNAIPESLAAAMATLLYDPPLAREMGQRGRDLWRGKGINWDSHISRLLGDH